jgi:hypothetical protein
MIAIAKRHKRECAASPNNDLIALEQRIENCVGQIRRHWAEIGHILFEIRSKRLYKPQSFDTWLRSHESWKISRQRADQYIRAAKLAAKIDNKCCHAGGASGHAIPNESVAREILKVHEALQPELWRKVKAISNGKPTAKKVRQVRAYWKEVTGEGTKPTQLTQKCKTSAITYRLEVIVPKSAAADAAKLRAAINTQKLHANSLGNKLSLKDQAAIIGSMLARIAPMLAELESAVSLTVRGAN